MSASVSNGAGQHRPHVFFSPFPAAEHASRATIPFALSPHSRGPGSHRGIRSRGAWFECQKAEGHATPRPAADRVSGGDAGAWHPLRVRRAAVRGYTSAGAGAHARVAAAARAPRAGARRIRSTPQAARRASRRTRRTTPACTARAAARRPPRSARRRAAGAAARFFSKRAPPWNSNRPSASNAPPPPPLSPSP